jgi:glucose-6-phosphate isomerase
MVVEALQFYKKSAECSFCFKYRWRSCKWNYKKTESETTSFVLFKTFTTQETLTNWN